MADLKIETELEIYRSPQVIYEAIVDPASMSHYFISSGTGRLDAGEHVRWKWDDQGGVELTITPGDLKPHERVSFLWGATGSETHVTIELEPIGDEHTKVKVCDAGVPRGEEGQQKCLDQMRGWVHMLCCLKAYLEFGVNLRVGKRTA